jgi:alpha-glucosidase (family GH31 glycosyl hydrolase)
LNLYSQFPVYVNIEPDGNCHLVAFYNSNPTEFYLTPFPSLTYRTLGGIFDIYIFMGPTPIQAIEQFQLAFGLPKLQPYWSYGLQIGSYNYGNLQTLDRFVQNFTNSKLPFDSVFIGTEYMQNSSMFSLSPSFYGINNFCNAMHTQSRSVVFTFIPGIVNKTSHYPYKIGTPNNKVWIYENFFSTPFIGKVKINKK